MRNVNFVGLVSTFCYGVGQDHFRVDDTCVVVFVEDDRQIEYIKLLSQGDYIFGEFTFNDGDVITINPIDLGTIQFEVRDVNKVD